MKEEGAVFEPRVVWSEEARAQVLPRRDSEPAPAPPEIDGPALRAEIQAQYDEVAQRLENGVGRSAADCAPIMREIIAHFSAEPHPELSVDAAAGAMVVLTYGWLGAQDTCSRCWIHERGLPFAVQTLCRSFDLHAEGDLREPAARFLFRTADAAQFKRPWEVGRLAEEKVHRLVDALSSLRRAVAAADDETYARARAVAEPVIGSASTPTPYRCALAFLFPTETAWVRAAAEACVAAGKPEESYYARHLDLAFAAVADPDLAARLAKLMEQVPDEPLVLTMLDRTGPAAVDALRTLSNTDGLMRIHSVAAVQALAPMLGQKGVMVARRRWTPAEFKQFFVDHPLLIHLVRRLVWGAFEGDALALAFRVAEDRSLADIEDQPLSLPAAAQIGIPHRLELGPDLAEAWGPVLADYELVQPFAQLARPVFVLEAAEREADCLTRYQHVKLPAPTLVFGLERLRWTRYDIIDGGGFNSHMKEFEVADTTAIVHYDGAVAMGYIEEAELCQLTTLCFQRSGGEAMKPGEVDPIVVSEALRDLDELAAKVE